MMKRPLLIRGMHGLGDNIRQRAIVRQLLPQFDVWLESSWVSVYHDLIGEGLKVIRKPTRLRTQTKNANREAEAFSGQIAPIGAQIIQMGYPPAEVRRRGSILAAMCAASGCDVATADFRLPVPAGWLARLTPFLRQWGYDGLRPIMVYRPLVDRPSDWTGCRARNPDHSAYATLYKSIRDRFFVVSVADLVPNIEWIVGERIEADAQAHRGELEFETLAALISMAGIVFCSPGFAAVLGQAVGTPVACIFGGYERSAFFFSGANDAPVLGIDPINPCECFRHDHACRKTINVPNARDRLITFAADAAARTAVAA